MERVVMQKEIDNPMQTGDYVKAFFIAIPASFLGMILVWFWGLMLFSWFDWYRALGVSLGYEFAFWLHYAISFIFIFFGGAYEFAKERTLMMRF